MRRLHEAIAREGTNLGGGILKVDHILNHQIIPDLMEELGQELGRRFRDAGADRVLTAEISGIAPALSTALVLGVPLVYARKKKPITMSGTIFTETAPSRTKGEEVSFMVAAEFLPPGERVLIVDDFLASGLTTLALARLVRSARSELVGIGVVVEKRFEEGRARLREAGYPTLPVVALATVLRMEESRIELAAYPQACHE
ncbi:MAG: xanthine phosphoribosyltransferase [Anaerolineaceae bacterium]|nr:xanthine phosphoribosyltransferase [Anaerolineaceae bacterium]MCY3934871.1 xanthine phosphoribosyltransferase [Chloroflexota bacterium]MCY4009846.1 xanthine phosphoribosyltransferase [Anaerolineaceae bacterium]MCY4106044.1 xanthine phosphoribosyltransferase [Chloroflexota bacterium]